MRVVEAVVDIAVRRHPIFRYSGIAQAMAAALDATVCAEPIRPLQRWEAMKEPPPSPRRWQR